MPEITLATTTLPIRRLVDDVDRGDLKLPEIQREYVWKAAQIAGLLDSLYRRYPSGSLLLWETDEVVVERKAHIDPTGAGSAGRRVQYLLDGQQRLTSLHRVFMGHGAARVVFNVDSERFQLESAATARDPRWVRVSVVLSTANLYDYVDALASKIPGLERSVAAERLARVKAISDYKYHVEVISDLPYEEVTEIFIRVNSRGRSLKATDLALAALSARWHGVMALLETERDRWAATYPAVDLPLLARALAATATTSRQLAGFKDTPQSELEEGWVSVKRGLSHLVPILKKNVGIDTSQLLPSANALVPLIVYLGTRRDDPTSDDEVNGLVYWLLSAFITGRYNQSADTKIAEDAKAVRGDNPVEALMANLGLLGTRISLNEQALAGKGAGSPYFLLSYLVARRAGARDWFFGTQIGLDAEGAQAIEYHHIHPQATIKASYSKSEVNDLANLAFISSRANKRISARSPAVYFPEVGDDELARHFVPLDNPLRDAGQYPAFAAERRRLLAEAMNEFLGSFEPSFLAKTATSTVNGARLVVNVYALIDSEPIVEFEAHTDGMVWLGGTPLADLRRFLGDLGDGRTGGITIGREDISVEGGTETFEIPIGPLVVSGTSSDWASMIQRELDESTDGGVARPPSEAWTGPRQPLAVTEAE